ncbi:cytochrome P450 [Streptomyces hoynatensis]|uniref:Cytochrome P450 n=1 Tax=Streptomyces hoynatensis TaxID=1141874 RepID=A0A3A9YYQ0_9ACTN|nr:cytochrome P450 [Streptomyces hoynatensis]RKN41178.1 cytochrome P450 [Streptomyces hoynatensis]
MPRDEGRLLDLPGEYTRLRQEEPVLPVTLPSGEDAWLVSRYEDVRSVLADERFSSRVAAPGYPRGFYFPVAPQPGAFVAVDPPEHTRYRRMIMSQFTKKHAESLRPRIQEIVDERIDELLASPKPVNLVTVFARPVPLMVVCDLLGVPYKDRTAFGRWINTLVEGNPNPAARNASAAALFGYMNQLVAEKERRPTDDVLGRLAAQRIRKGELTRNEAVVMGMMLLSAGYDTTASSISLSTLALLRNPEVGRRLREEPELIAGAVEELLRNQNVMQHGVARVAMEDVELAGQVIREGEGVIALTSSADRDESVYPEPDRVDITRSGTSPLAFGHGRHSCIAKFLARVELQVALLTLVQRIPDLRLAVPHEELRFRRSSAMVHSVNELPVTW